MRQNRNWNSYTIDEESMVLNYSKRKLENLLIFQWNTLDKIFNHFSFEVNITRLVLFPIIFLWIHLTTVCNNLSLFICQSFRISMIILSLWTLVLRRGFQTALFNFCEYYIMVWKENITWKFRIPHRLKNFLDSMTSIKINLVGYFLSVKCDFVFSLSFFFSNFSFIVLL